MAAASYWKKAAKGGVVAAMYKLGTHFYRGDIASLGRSGEDAVMWLQRFIKAVDPAASAGASSSVAAAKARPPSPRAPPSLTVSAMLPVVPCYLACCFGHMHPLV